MPELMLPGSLRFFHWRQKDSCSWTPLEALLTKDILLRRLQRDYVWSDESRIRYEYLNPTKWYLREAGNWNSHTDLQHWSDSPTAHETLCSSGQCHYDHLSLMQRERSDHWNYFKLLFNSKYLEEITFSFFKLSWFKNSRWKIMAEIHGKRKQYRVLNEEVLFPTKFSLFWRYFYHTDLFERSFVGNGHSQGTLHLFFSCGE